MTHKPQSHLPTETGFLPPGAIQADAPVIPPPMDFFPALYDLQEIPLFSAGSNGHYILNI